MKTKNKNWVSWDDIEEEDEENEMEMQIQPEAELIRIPSAWIQNEARFDKDTGVITVGYTRLNRAGRRALIHDE